MIEPTERGITIAKPLAWTMLIALISGGVWVGVKIGTLDEIARRVGHNEVRLQTLEARAAAAERDAAVFSAQLEAIHGLVARIDQRIARMEERYETDR